MSAPNVTTFSFICFILIEKACKYLQAFYDYIEMRKAAHYISKCKAIFYLLSLWVAAPVTL